MSKRKKIYLCLAHMSEDGAELKYINEAFETNWVVPLGPNVDGFEKDLEDFVNHVENADRNDHADLKKRVVALSSGTAAVHLGLLAAGVEDAAEGFGSRYNGQVLGTFGKYGVLSFNGNKMITTSGGGALITEDEEHWREIMMYATQYRESYPYYQHEKIGYNYRMSNICAGIGRGQMTVVNDHLAHHKHVQKMYEELLANVPGVHVHSQPNNGDYDSNYWLCTITIDENVKVKGQEDAYKTIVTGAVGGAAGVIHAAESAHTDCEPNANVEAMRVALDKAQIEARPVWKPMHKQPCYKDVPAYVNGVSEALFKVGMCLPAGPYVTDDDVRYIVDTIKAAIERA